MRRYGTTGGTKAAVRRGIILLALAGAGPAATLAQAPEGPRARPMPGPRIQPAAADRTMKARVIEKLAVTLERRYVDSTLAVDVGAKLRRNLERGQYDGAATAVEFGDALLADLQGAVRDRHLRVRFAPEMAAMLSDTGGATDAGAERRREESRVNNHGVRRVEVLQGNVGYLDLRQFAPVTLAAPTIVAAMNVLGNVDALIVDLRENGGGDPATVQLLCSYLFGDGDPVHLNSLYHRAGNETNQFWTLPFVPGRRLDSAPVYVLTSDRTFSGAEEFAYNLQSRRRATVMGDTTGGGANPGEFFPLSDGFVAFVSTGRAVNPVTGTNWEGTGVVPDIRVPIGEVLSAAHQRALRDLIARCEDPERKRRLEWDAEGVAAASAPLRLAIADLEPYAGIYGIRTVEIRDGRLTYQRQGGPLLTMTPLGKDLFALDGGDTRIRFRRGPGGEVVGFDALMLDGPGFSEERSH